MLGCQSRISYPIKLVLRIEKGLLIETGALSGLQFKAWHELGLCSVPSWCSSVIQDHGTERSLLEVMSVYVLVTFTFNLKSNGTLAETL